MEGRHTPFWLRVSSEIPSSHLLEGAPQNFSFEFSFRNRASGSPRWFPTHYVARDDLELLPPLRPPGTIVACHHAWFKLREPKPRVSRMLSKCAAHRVTPPGPISEVSAKLPYCYSLSNLPTEKVYLKRHLSVSTRRGKKQSWLPEIEVIKEHKRECENRPIF